MRDLSDPDKKPPQRPCPICGKARADKYRPFCSKRCADVDLHRWLSGTYSVPVVEEEDEDGTPSAGEAGDRER